MDNIIEVAKASPNATRGYDHAWIFNSPNEGKVTLSFENTTSISYVLDSYETEAAKLDDNNYVISLKKEKYFYQRSISYSDGFYSLNDKEVFSRNA